MPSLSFKNAKLSKIRQLKKEKSWAPPVLSHFCLAAACKLPAQGFSGYFTNENQSFCLCVLPFHLQFFKKPGPSEATSLLLCKQIGNVGEGRREKGSRRVKLQTNPAFLLIVHISALSSSRFFHWSFRMHPADRHLSILIRGLRRKELPFDSSTFSLSPPGERNLFSKTWPRRCAVCVSHNLSPCCL